MESDSMCTYYSSVSSESSIGNKNIEANMKTEGERNDTCIHSNAIECYLNPLHESYKKKKKKKKHTKKEENSSEEMEWNLDLSDADEVTSIEIESMKSIKCMSPSAPVCVTLVFDDKCYIDHSAVHEAFCEYRRIDRLYIIMKSKRYNTFSSVLCYIQRTELKKLLHDVTHVCVECPISSDCRATVDLASMRMLSPEISSDYIFPRLQHLEFDNVPVVCDASEVHNVIANRDPLKLNVFETLDIDKRPDTSRYINNGYGRIQEGVLSFPGARVESDVFREYLCDCVVGKLPHRAILSCKNLRLRDFSAIAEFGEHHFHNLFTLELQGNRRRIPTLQQILQCLFTGTAVFRNLLEIVIHTNDFRFQLPAFEKYVAQISQGSKPMFELPPHLDCIRLNGPKTQCERFAAAFRCIGVCVNLSLIDDDECILSKNCISAVPVSQNISSTSRVQKTNQWCSSSADGDYEVDELRQSILSSISRNSSSSSLSCGMSPLSIETMSQEDVMSDLVLPQSFTSSLQSLNLENTPQQQYSRVSENQKSFLTGEAVLQMHTENTNKFLTAQKKPQCEMQLAIDIASLFMRNAQKIYNLLLYVDFLSDTQLKIRDNLEKIIISMDLFIQKLEKRKKNTKIFETTKNTFL